MSFIGPPIILGNRTSYSSDKRVNTRVFTIFRPLLNFRRKSQGEWVGLPKISSEEGGLPIFGPRRPKIGAKGALLEFFFANFRKMWPKML